MKNCNEAGSGQSILKVCYNLPTGTEKNQEEFRWDNQCLSQIQQETCKTTCNNVNIW